MPESSTLRQERCLVTVSSRRVAAKAIVELTFTAEVQGEVECTT